MSKPTARPGSLENEYDCAVTLRYVAPSGITLEDCLRPDYWKDCLRELGQQRVPGRHAFNKVSIIAQDGTWEAMLRNMSIADGLAYMRVLDTWKAPAHQGKMPQPPEGYLIDLIDNNGWRVLDEHGQPVATNLTTREDAIRAAAKHAKKVAA